MGGQMFKARLTSRNFSEKSKIWMEQGETGTDSLMSLQRTGLGANDIIPKIKEKHGCAYATAPLGNHFKQKSTGEKKGSDCTKVTQS